MRSLVTALLMGSALWSPALAADTALITVTGEGTVEAKPDMATINLGVTTEGATAAEAMAANSAQLGAVLEQLRAAGIYELWPLIQCQFQNPCRFQFPPDVQMRWNKPYTNSLHLACLLWLPNKAIIPPHATSNL